MAGKKSLSKGKKGEYLARKKLEGMGYEVVNQAEDSEKPDLRVGDKNFEIKYRASVPKCLYDWLDEKGADALMIKRVSRKDRDRPWLIVTRLEQDCKI